MLEKKSPKTNDSIPVYELLKEKMLLKVFDLSGLIVRRLISYRCQWLLKKVQPYRVNYLAKETRNIIKKNNKKRHPPKLKK